MPHWFCMLPVVCVNVCASLLLKTGAGDPPAPLLLHLMSLRSLAGLMCFGLGGVAYAWLLRFVPLSIAQAVLSTQYIFTVLGAWLLLHESISHTQWAGFILVAVGLSLVVSQ